MLNLQMVRWIRLISRNEPNQTTNDLVVFMFNCPGRQELSLTTSNWSARWFGASVYSPDLEDQLILLTRKKGIFLPCRARFCALRCPWTVRRVRRARCVRLYRKKTERTSGRFFFEVPHMRINWSSEDQMIPSGE